MRLLSREANQKQDNRGTDSRQEKLKYASAVAARKCHQDDGNPDEQDGEENRNILHAYHNYVTFIVNIPDLAW
jgi:hypothetical protein